MMRSASGCASSGLTRISSIRRKTRQKRHAPSPSGWRRLETSRADRTASRSVIPNRSRLTLTQIYNVLEKLRRGEALDDAEEAIKDKGLVLIVKELHDRIDGLAAEAYGWPADLSDDEILARLVALNAERAAEEKRGLVRWLRPDYQRARQASRGERRRGRTKSNWRRRSLSPPTRSRSRCFPRATWSERRRCLPRSAARGGRSTRRSSRVPSGRAPRLSRQSPACSPPWPASAIFTRPTVGIMRFAAGRDQDDVATMFQQYNC